MQPFRSVTRRMIGVSTLHASSGEAATWIAKSPILGSESVDESLRSMHGGIFARFFVEHLQAVAATRRELNNGRCNGLAEARNGGDGRPRKSCPSRIRRSAWGMGAVR